MPSPQQSFRRGVEALGRGHFLRARRHLAAAATLGGRDAPWAVQELVQTFLRGGDASGAEPLLRSLLAQDTALLVHGLGYLQRRLGQRDEARACFRDALAAAPRLLAAEIELAWMRFQDGERERADRAWRRAEVAFREMGDAWGTASVLTHRATAAREEMRLGAARELFDRAAEAKRACGELLGEATALYGGAQVLQACALHREAILRYRRALEIQRRVRFPLGEAASLNGLGTCYLELSDGDRAEEAFRAALSALRRVGHAGTSLHAALVRKNVGDACLVRDDMRGARRGYRRAIALLEHEPLGANGHALAALHLARLELHVGRPRAARATLASLPAARRAAADLITRVGLAADAAECMRQLGEPAAAVGSALEARQLARAVEGPGEPLAVQGAVARLRLGRALVAAGDVTGGLAELEAAAEDVDRLVAAQPVRSLRLGLLESLRDVHDGLVGAHLQAGAVRAAWSVAAGCKGRELREAAARAGGEGAGEVTPLLEVEAEIRRLSASAELSPDERRRLALARRRHEDLGDVTATPAARTLRGKAADARAVSDVLGAGAALVEYQVAEDGTRAFVIVDGDVEVVELALRRLPLAAAIASTFGCLARVATAEDPAAELAAFDVEASARLFRRLVQPVLRRLPPGTRRLVLVPDGPLHGLPWTALVSARGTRAAAGGCLEEAASARYLGDELEIVTAPSAHLLAAALPPVAGEGASVLAFSPEAGTVLQLADGAHALAVLAEAHREAEEVAARHGAARMAVGRRATAERLSADAGRPGVLHVAAHARADARAPGLSGLVLAGEGGEGIDFVTADRIARLSARARLVVLSACETARGRTWQREGTLGLTRAFLHAGAAATLATLWPVDDRLSRRLAVALHGRLAAGDDPSTALTAARRELRDADDSLARHPFAWAGMTLLDTRPGRGGA